MRKILLFAFITVLSMTCCALAADWIQIDEKIYLDASSLNKYEYNLNYNKDNLYSIWKKSLNDGRDIWKDSEKIAGKKLWYDKTLLIINCTKREIAVKSFVLYDLKENVAYNHDYSYLDWQSVVPETIGEAEYTLVCSAVAPKVQMRSHR